VVLRREPVDGTAAGRSGSKDRQARDAAAEGRHEQLRVVARNRKARDRRRGRGRYPVVACKPQDHGRLRHRQGKAIVVRRQCRDDVVEGLELGRRLSLADDLGGRQAVGLGQDEIKGDRRGTGLAQALDDLGQLAPRPGPLTDAGQRRLVDVDDADRQRGIGCAGREPQKAVEYGEAQTRHGLGIGHTQCDREQQHEGGQNQMDRRCAHVRIF
jgi:hypothetical protein